MYYTREVEGLQYPIYCRRKGTMEAAEEVLIDMNELAEGPQVHAARHAGREPGRHRRLAYTVDFTGFRQYKLQVKDLATGKLLDDTAERVTSTAWAADNRTLFYVEEDETTKRSYRLHRHTLGGATAAGLRRARRALRHRRGRHAQRRVGRLHERQQGHVGSSRAARATTPRANSASSTSAARASSTTSTTTATSSSSAPTTRAQLPRRARARRRSRRTATGSRSSPTGRW